VAISWRALVTRAAERTAKLPVAAVARHHHQQGQGLLPAHVRPQGARLIEVAREPLHLAAPIPELALHQIASRRVDGGRAIELLEDRVLRGQKRTVLMIVSLRALAASSRTTVSRSARRAGFSENVSQIASTRSSREGKCW
jgi:hypothetical protein